MGKKDKKAAKKEKKAAAKAQKKIVKKVKTKVKKRWVQIIAPRSFENITLGESNVENADKVVGKTLTANLMNLTGDMRNQGVEIRFDVVKASEGKALAAVTGYKVLPSHMKRLVRRGRTKVDDSFVVRNKSGRLIRIKPVVLTANTASKGAQTAIRMTVRSKIKQLLQTMPFDQLVQDLIGFKVQRYLKDEAGKHHPIKGVEVVACFLLPEGTSEARTVSEDAAPEEEVEGVDVGEAVPAENASESEVPVKPAKEDDSAESTVKPEEEAPVAEVAPAVGVDVEAKAPMESKPVKNPAKEEGSTEEVVAEEKPATEALVPEAAAPAEEEAPEPAAKPKQEATPVKEEAPAEKEAATLAGEEPKE